MLKKIYEIIEPSDNENSKVSSFYDIIMLICIIASMIPLAIKSDNMILNIIDKITVVLFIIDYIFRLITAKQKLNKGIKSYFLYPIQPMAIIDLLSILPSLVPINSGFKVLRLFRIVRTLKVFRSFKIFRYSKNISRLVEVLKKQSKSLLAVLSMAVFYVLFTALVMFNIEPDTFNNFFDAIYWAAISLTSVGYGDITPVSNVGRLFTMLSAFVGVAIIALPSGIITAGYLDVLKNEDEDK
ncbi:MAG: ion transporter [Acetobacter sp.]|nr:ion transporter [Bacteroides sp.]MCM1341888.1 ion transporter [Acetobacter sp.]MCM1433185.1 ion transporter [Clostridiales bacterium]